jgi:hypothetical protein
VPGSTAHLSSETDRRLKPIGFASLEPTRPTRNSVPGRCRLVPALHWGQLRIMATLTQHRTGWRLTISRESWPDCHRQQT